MKADTQRNKYKPLRFAWRWEVCIRGPPGSPYEGDSYRVLVRLPLAFPATPPKLHFLSIMSHLEVETRDPYEGQLDESFYERLAERMPRLLLVGAPKLDVTLELTACSVDADCVGVGTGDCRFGG